MMKKVIKKLLAALLAVAMVCAMAIPAFAYESWETKEDLYDHHSYIAFQIFKGVISSKDNPTLPTLPTLPLFRKFLRLSANGTIPMLTASLSRVLYATISTRMVEPRNPTL